MVRSLYESLCNMESIYADRAAIRYFDETSAQVVEIPYRRYAADLRRFVAFVRSKTSQPGQRIALLARNSYQYVIALYGSALAGAVAVPLNWNKTWDEIRYELELTDPVCILQDGEYLDREPALAQQFGEKLADIGAFAAFDPALDVAEQPDLNALAFIMFTSGTTGRSKGVMMSQANLFGAMPAFLDPFDDMQRITGWSLDGFCSLSALPMFHISAMTSLVSWSLKGLAVNLCNDLKYFYRDLAAMPSDVMAVVPVLLKSIYKDVMKGRRERLGGLRVLTCAAAMFDRKMLLDLMDKGFFIAQMYGLTETCGDGAYNTSQEEKYLSSVGKMDPNLRFKLEDGELCIQGQPVMLGYYKEPEMLLDLMDKGFFIAQMYGLTETCGDGAYNTSQEEKYLSSVGKMDPNLHFKLEDGELCIQGQPVMLGYYKEPEATDEVLDAEGWFHTGDLAQVTDWTLRAGSTPETWPRSQRRATSILPAAKRT